MSLILIFTVGKSSARGAVDSAGMTTTCSTSKKAAAAARIPSTDAKHNATYAIRIGASMIVAGIVAESLRVVQVSLLLARALAEILRLTTAAGTWE